MRVSLIDPSAFTPPYDRSLAGALAAKGAEVELLTRRFLHGPVPPARGYRVREAFYRRSSKRGLDASARRAVKGVEHLTDMVRLRRSLEADIAHFQWLTFPFLDAHLLPPDRPRLLTAHYILPPAPRRSQIQATRRVYDRMDAVVAHSARSADRLISEVGMPSNRVHVIPHGAFDYLTDLPQEMPLPAELEGTEGPVILFFGLLRSYKGIEDLLHAFRAVRDAELWIVGNPRMDIRPLRGLAAQAGGRVRFVARFIDEAEIPAIFRRADLVVLPYHDAEHSGVLYTALAFGKPMLVTDVGGFAEIGERYGAAQVVPAERPAELGSAIAELLRDERAREELARGARAAAAGEFSWARVATQTLGLYEELLAAAR